MKHLLLIATICLIPLSCKKQETKTSDATQTVLFDCPDTVCEELLVTGDPYQVNPDFYGYADPSIRKDPESNEIWLSYSFPHYKMLDGSPVPSVSIHLAKSTNGGTVWNFVKKLFEPVEMVNPAEPAQEGFLDHETINLIPVRQDTETFWCAARLNYFIPREGGFSARPNNSFHITVLKANTVVDLTAGDSTIIGGSLTHSGWNEDVKLIPPDLSTDFFFWNEPSLYYDEVLNRLYLVMVAFVYNGPTPLMSKNDVYVYATAPDGNPSGWNWVYKGKLIDSAIANELGGERITQTDIAVGVDGKLLLIGTPDDWNSDKMDFNHKGCKVVEIKSLEIPELERDNQGKLRVRVSISASDANDLGSGASAYDHNSATGILFTKRVKTDMSLTANIRKTYLKP